MHKVRWRIVQGAVGAAILLFLVRGFLKNWSKVQDQPIQWNIRWEFVVASLLVTWAMYGVLIWGWRSVLQGWRESIRILDAVRIWTISGLISIIPGMIWSIAGMAMLAQQRGVSGTAATGSAVVMQLVSLATGAVMALALVGTPLLDRFLGGWGTVAAMLLAAVTLACAVALTSPSLTRLISFLLRRPGAVRPVDPSALAAALFANAVAWAGYGLALQVLALGTLRGVDLSWATATGAFAASYIVGYLAIFLPGGLGLRELVMIAILTPTIGVGPAAALAAVSRIVLTFNQVGAAVPFLLFRSKPRAFSRSA